MPGEGTIMKYISKMPGGRGRRLILGDKTSGDGTFWSLSLFVLLLVLNIAHNMRPSMRIILQDIKENRQKSVITLPQRPNFR